MKIICRNWLKKDLVFYLVLYYNQFYSFNQFLNNFISNGCATKTIRITKTVVKSSSVIIEFNPSAINLGLKNGIMVKINGTMAIHTMIAIFHFLGFFPAVILSISYLFVIYFNRRLQNK